MTYTLEGLELFRTIQCYSCFQWCNHYRPDCPTKHEPQICSRCTKTGHDYSNCTNEHLCINCGGKHPATARICPEYLRAIETHKPAIAKQLAHYVLTHTDSDLNRITQTDSTIVTGLLRLSTLEATNEQEFVKYLFKLQTIYA